MGVRVCGGCPKNGGSEKNTVPSSLAWSESIGCVAAWLGQVLAEAGAARMDPAPGDRHSGFVSAPELAQAVAARTFLSTL